MPGGPSPAARREGAPEPAPQDWSGLDLLPDATLVCDGEGIVVHVNPLAARLLAVDREQVRGKTVHDAAPLVDETGADWWSCAHALDGDARLLPRIPEADLILTGRRGHSRPVLVTGARHAGPDGRVELLVLSLRKGNRRRRLDAARSDLVSTVSHELRSPLTSVKGFTKTLLAKWDSFSDAQKRQMLATVNEDADRVTRLLGELLDVSRIDAGRLHLRRQMVDVPVIAGRVVERLAVGAAGPRLVSQFDEGLPRLYADPDKVEQIFTNLIENALKYGGGTIVVRGREHDEEVRFGVIDEGDGIAEQHLRSIFTKFFRRAGERRSGTGLGLFITKGLVEAHGGRIWAESRPGQGAAFHFTLPKGGLELAGVPLDMLSPPRHQR
jgi:signal transduction histidine kinase